MASTPVSSVVSSNTTFSLFSWQERKSIGAEVNWGVRFNDLNDVSNSF